MLQAGSKDQPKRSALQKMVELANASGSMQGRKGILSGVLALTLGGLSVLAVLAYRFPAYLTTPELRQNYDPELLRYVLAGAMIISACISLFNVVLNRHRWLASWAFASVALALALGGPGVKVGHFPESSVYLGVDWLVLDLLGSALIFVFIEKLFAHKKEQPIFRAEWQTDLKHFAVNHLLIGVGIVLVNHWLRDAMSWTQGSAVQNFIAQLPFLPALVLTLLVADLAQYWTHRAYHEVPALWRLHAVHHSAPHMDWIAGSRQHLLELFLTRILVLAPVFALGFSAEVVDAYVIVVGFQAVFNHANVSVRLGPLSYVIVTPNFHHWHHSQDDEAIDKNYAAHFAFIDHLFGTAVQADRKWPDRYGVVGDYVPRGYFAQLLFPFRGSTASLTAPADDHSAD